MSITKTKKGTYTVVYSSGFHPITRKRIRMKKEGISTLSEAKHKSRI